MKNLQRLFAPESVAVIGASATMTKSGGMLFRNIAQGAFKGKLYPVNPRADQILGHKAYPDIGSVPDSVNLVFIVLPREHVVDAVEKCAAAKAGAVCIITSGFSELGEIGSADQEKLRRISEQSEMSILGPNTIGVVNARIGLMGSFVRFPKWESGGISMFSQSGIFSGGLLLDYMSRDVQRPPVGLTAGAGNKVDINEIDFMCFCADDPDTAVIGMYLESIENPRAFLDAAAEVRRKKPIIVMKSGRTLEGARASSSHTGSQATDDALLDAGLRQYGIARAMDESEFIDALRSLAVWPKMPGRRLAVATTSGGLGVISTDLLVCEGMELSEFSPETMEELSRLMPTWVKPANPFDFWVGAEMHGTRLVHERGLEALLKDPNVDAVVGILLAASMTDFPEMASSLRDLAATHNKPLAIVIYGDESGRRWTNELEGSGIPIFGNTRAAVRALSLAATATGSLDS